MMEAQKEYWLLLSILLFEAKKENNWHTIEQVAPSFEEISKAWEQWGESDMLTCRATIKMLECVNFQLDTQTETVTIQA